MDKDRNSSLSKTGENGSSCVVQAHHPLTLSIDWARCERYLEDSDLSDAEKREFIATLWNIMVGFVDLGFRLQPPHDSCGKAGERSAQRPIDAADGVISPKRFITKNFEIAASPANDQGAEGKEICNS